MILPNPTEKQILELKISRLEAHIEVLVRTLCDLEKEAIEFAAEHQCCALDPRVMKAVRILLAPPP